MQVALFGLSQSGKTTLFTALTGHHPDPVAAATPGHIEKTIVKVPDPRLDKLTEMYKPKKTTHATIEFLDLPGLDFTSEGGKQESRRTIAQARQADMLVAVVRAFANDSVMAYKNRIDPAGDLDELQSEMLMADMESVANRIEKLEKSVRKPSKTQDKEKRELELMMRCNEKLEKLEPLAGVIENADEEKIVKSFGFLTMKPLCIVLNIGEDHLQEAPAVEIPGNIPMIPLAAEIEAELASLDEADRGAFLDDLGISEIARDKLINHCYTDCKLISFLTAGEDEVRAWTIPYDCPAVEAAGAIHSDIQRGFIRAETVSYEDLMACGDMKGAKAAGKVRLEGKTYPVKDGDIINFRFNV